MKKIISLLAVLAMVASCGKKAVTSSTKFGDIALYWDNMEFNEETGRVIMTKGTISTEYNLDKAIVEDEAEKAISRKLLANKKYSLPAELLTFKLDNDKNEVLKYEKTSVNDRVLEYKPLSFNIELVAIGLGSGSEAKIQFKIVQQSMLEIVDDVAAKGNKLAAEIKKTNLFDRKECSGINAGLTCDAIESSFKTVGFKHKGDMEYLQYIVKNNIK